jgi:ABC-2 type transport system permease protein
MVASVLAAFASSSFGVLLSFAVKESEQVMVVFNLVRFPMIFLADVIIPVTSFPQYLIPVVLMQPLTYMAEALSYGYTGSYDLVQPVAPFSVMLLSGILFLYDTAALISKGRP